MGSVTLMKMKNDLPIVEFSKEPCDYRVYCVSEEGLHIGGVPIHGDFPWTIARGVVRGILQSWARQMFVRQDGVGLCNVLGRWARDWSSKRGNIEVGALSPEPFLMEKTLRWLKDTSIERKAYFAQRYGGRDGSVMLHLSNEMIEAVRYCLKQFGVRPRLRWEVQSSPDAAEVYHTLFQGGKHDQS